MPKLSWFFLVAVCSELVLAFINRSGYHHHRVKHGQRIINGTRALHSRFPFVVSIQAHNVTSGRWLHGCGGSIVNDRTILTACHCVAPKILGATITYGNYDIMRVVAGTDSLDHPSRSAQISAVSELVASPKCSNYPQYDDGWYGHDVAFVVLKKRLRFNSDVQPMLVYSVKEHESNEMLKRMVHLGQTCFVPGWGTTTEFEGITAEYLMVSKVNLIPAARCRNMFCELAQAHCYSHFDNIGQVCGVSRHSSDCQGDSGGPLVCLGMVFGTVSYGERCLPGWPSVFQSIGPILDLIHSRPVRGVRAQMRKNRYGFSSRGYQLPDYEHFGLASNLFQRHKLHPRPRRQHKPVYTANYASSPVNISPYYLSNYYNQYPINQSTPKIWY